MCWTWPGIEAIGTGSAMPSFTNSGAIRSEGRTSVSRTSSRSAAVRRRRRDRCSGNPIRAAYPSARSPHGSSTITGIVRVVFSS